MSEIEKIQRYIDRTGIAPEVVDRYCLHQGEMKAFFEQMRKSKIGAMDVIFSFGLAKGYRAAKAEGKAGAAQMGRR